MEAQELSEVFRQRLRRVREAKPWTQDDLVARLAELGYPLDRSNIARLESGRRRVSLEDVLIFAVALGVAPVDLLLPLSDDAWIKVGNLKMRTRPGRDWLGGLGPLLPDDRKDFFYRSRSQPASPFSPLERVERQLIDLLVEHRGELPPFVQGKLLAILENFKPQREELEDDLVSLGYDPEDNAEVLVRKSDPELEAIKQGLDHKETL